MQEMYDVSRGLGELTHDLKIPLVAIAPMSSTLENCQKMLFQHSWIPRRSPKTGTEHILFLYHDELSSAESTSKRLIIATILITNQQNGIVTELEISTQADHSI